MTDLYAERETADRRFVATMRRKYQARADDDSQDIMRLIELFETTPVGYQRAVLATLQRAERMEAEVNEWRECALYDALMEGPTFKGWNRSALDRCRRKYIEADL